MFDIIISFFRTLIFHKIV